MNRAQIIKNIQDLSVRFKTDTIKQKHIRTVPKLEYYISLQFPNLADAIKEAGLKPTPLAEKMGTSDKELLIYLKNLGEKLGKRPTVSSVKRDGIFSERIFKKRFGGIKVGYQLALKEVGPKPETAPTIDEGEEVSTFANKGRFYGEAAEFYVTAELLYRGYNAASLPTDLGMDVIAVKESKTFYLQVKNIDLGKSTGRSIGITTSSFTGNQSSNVFYVFVLKTGQRKEILILPYIKIRELINDGIIQIDKESKKFAVNIVKNGSSISIASNDRKKSSNVSSYLNDWGSIN